MVYSLFTKPGLKAGPVRLSPPSATISRDGSNGADMDQKQSHKPFICPASLPPVSIPSIPSHKSSGVNPEFNPTPYPCLPAYFPTPHPNVTVERVKTAYVPSLMRITGLLLPVRYPNSFYSAIITDPVIASVSRVAIYHDHPVTDAAASLSACATSPSLPSSEKVVGGIRCRLEPLASTPSHTSSRAPVNLYIQTLHLLSPYRGYGIATSLLGSLIFDSPDITASRRPEIPLRRVSSLVKHYNIRIVTAHVHENNEEALRWYVARGFKIQNGVIEGYYRRLNPGGARIVRLDLEWGDGDDEDDDDWEKIELNEYSGSETLEDHVGAELGKST